MDNFVNYATILGWRGLSVEYEELKHIPPTTHTYTAQANNAGRNRYRDVPCPDATRVQLRFNVPPETDYIHANWIKYEGFSRSFIATQGPLESTTSDFWRMVYQEGEQASPGILMVCRIEEENKQKCYQYWPLKQGESKTYGCMQVINKRIENADKFTIYVLEVLPEGFSNSVIATLYVYPDWPDRLLPASPMAVLRMLKHLRNNRSITGSYIVHCSAGLGRTGALIALEIGMQQLIANQNPNVKNIVKTIRDQRPGLVKTAAQYVFIYAGLLYYCHAKGKSPAAIAKFHAQFCEAMSAQRI